MYAQGLKNLFWLLVMLTSFILLFNVGKFDWFKKINYFWLKIRFRSEYILACDYHKGFDEIYEGTPYCYLIATKDGLRLHPLYKIFARDLYIPYKTIINFTILNDKYDAKGISDKKTLKTIKYIAFLEIAFLPDNVAEQDTLRVYMGSKSYYYFNKYTMARADFFENMSTHLPTGEILHGFPTW